MQYTTIKQFVSFPNGIQETLSLGQAALVSKDNSIPKAYINYLFFDKENNFKSGGYRQVSEAAPLGVEWKRSLGVVSKTTPYYFLEIGM